MDKLIEDLKVAIVDHLNLEDVNPTEIENDQPLFGEGLELDSIDALELIVLVESNYGIKITDPEQGKKVFESINSLAQFISENK